MGRESERLIPRETGREATMVIRDGEAFTKLLASMFRLRFAEQEFTANSPQPATADAIT